MKTNYGNKMLVFRILLAIFAVVLAEENAKQGDSPIAKSQEWNVVDPSLEKGAWVPAEGGNLPQGPIGGWDDDNDRGFLPVGNLGPDDDPKEWKIEDAIPGIPGQSYPNYLEVPDTTFDCRSQKDPGYYGDVEARCQVFHICQIDGRQNSFLCPVGTLFDQKTFVCDWWFNVNCADTPNYYFINSNLYKEGGSVGSEWSARRGDTSRNWGNVAQPIPDGAVRWTMRDNLDITSRTDNVAVKGNGHWQDTTNYNKGSDGHNVWNRQNALGGNTLGAGRNLFEGFRTDGQMKGTSTRRSQNRRMMIMQNQKGGYQRWSESVWPSSNAKEHINFDDKDRNMKGGFNVMNGVPRRRNEWDNLRNPNPLKGQNSLDASWSRGKGSAFQERGITKGSSGRPRQVSWTSTVNHDLQNWNKGANEIYPRPSNVKRDSQRKFIRREFQMQGYVSNAHPKGENGRWNGMSRRINDNLQWDDDYDRQRQNDYDY